MKYTRTDHSPCIIIKLGSVAERTRTKEIDLSKHDHSVFTGFVCVTMVNFNISKVADQPTAC